MNVVQVTRRLVKDDWGGAETVILETCKRLLREGIETELLCTIATASSASEDVDGLQVRRFPYFYPYIGLSEEAKGLLDRKGGSPFSFALMKALRNCRDLDLIHLHTGGRLGGIARHVALERRIPYVISLHGGVFDVPDEDARTWTMPTKGALDWGKVLGWWVGSRRVLDDAAAILCVGQPEQIRAQERFPEKRVIYLPNGVAPERFKQGDGSGFRARHEISQDAYVITTVARIDSQKNQLFTVRMLPQLLGLLPQAHVLLVGPITNPSYLSEIEDAVKEKGLQGHVTIVPGLEGSSQGLVDAYHASDLFLLSSIHEPFGIVILEAWAAGLPVLATDVGGIPYFVEDAQDGVLYPSNDEGAFLEAVRGIAGDPERARALAEAGQQKAGREYSWDAITARLVEIYEEVIRENPLRR